MNSKPGIVKASQDLYGAQVQLNQHVTELLAIEETGPLLDEAKALIRLDIILMEHRLNDLRDAVGFTLADDLIASSHPELPP